MRSIERPTCPVCAGAGRVRYEQLEDRLFAAPGSWRMVACEDAGCGTLWLDPAPLPEDLAAAYDDYYTHAADARSPSSRRERVIATRAHRDLGYPQPAAPAEALATLAGALPRYRELAGFARLYLPYVPDGRVLDVGCGSGNQLALLAQAGWQAEGLDMDPQAVAAVRARGLSARCGDLLQTDLPAQHFDAVTLVHVIEHLPDPQAHLRAALRRLKPGGRLISITPNVHALGHRLHGADWRGLEPPRHLQLFTANGLARLLREAGFVDVAVRSSARGADENLAASNAIAEARRQGTRAARAVRPGMRDRLIDIVERAGVVAGVNWGEELVADARRAAR